MVRQKGSYDRVWSMVVSPTFRHNTTQYHEIHPLLHSGCEGLNKSTELDEGKSACWKEGETSQSLLLVPYIRVRYKKRTRC